MSKKSTKIIAVAGVVAGLGVAALPALTFASETVRGEVELTASVSDAIAMTITGNGDGSGEGVDVFNPAGATNINGHTGGTAQSTTLQTSSSTASLLPNDVNDDTAISTIQIWTNCSDGYSLTVKASDAGTDLILDGVTGTPAANEKIEANATLTAGTNHWAYKVGDGSFTAITASDAPVNSSVAPVAGDSTTVTYGFSTLATQKTGDYKGSVIYTATTN